MPVRDYQRSHTNSHVNSHTSRHLHEHSMSAIHKQQVCAAFDKGLQALGRGLPPQALLKTLSRSLRDHVPSCEGCAQDGNEREDAHVAERGDEACCQSHTAEQQGVVPADTILQLVTFL